MNTSHQTLAMETYAKRSYNYFSRMVDQDGQPYFNVFWTEPAEAAHDWPDVGDVTSRQWQGAIMGRRMTGEGVPIEKTWRRRVLQLMDPKTNLLVRPATTYSQSVADPGDQCLTLYALVTAYADSREEVLRQATLEMVDGIAERIEKNGNNDPLCGGFMIKSLMPCARYLGYEPALRLAGRITHHVFQNTPLFTPDNTFAHGGHMHGNLRTLLGAADWALTAGDPVIYSRVDAIYRWVRSVSTRFGFLAEAIGRKADIVPCETCAIMDYLGLIVTLANHGHPEYWGDAERVARNHLIESQLTDGSWLHSDNARADTDQFTWRDIGERMIGGYAGWSSPNHFLGARETLNKHWGGPELKDKTRVFQNCCGGSGTHAFFIVWKNAARFADGCLSVNMHLDKLLTQAEIRGYQPFQGLTTIHLQEPCRVRVRIPEFTTPDKMKVEANGNEVAGKVWGNYLELGERQAGETLRITYPLPITTEEVTIGHPGCRQYHYQVTWKGDTVVKMEPAGNDYATGYSDYDMKDVPVFYGKEGPGLLYQRDYMLGNDIMPEPAPIHLDDGALDLWYINKGNQP